MKRNRERVKAELMTEISVIVDKYLAWGEATKRPNLRQIEDITLELREEIGQRMAEVMIENQEAKQPPAAPVCLECGGKLVYRGQKEVQAESRLGIVGAERGYYHCAHCKRGIFPPGRAVGVGGWSL